MQPSFYNSVLNVSLAASGSETSVTTNTAKTLTGETLSFSYVTPFSKGYIVVDPFAEYGSQPEIISYTGITVNSDGTCTFTGCTRGESSVTTGAVTANKVFHPIGSPVIISWGSQNISDVVTYLNSLISGANGNASSTVAGITKLSVDPVTSTDPIAVGDNDIRISQYTVDTGTANTYAIAPSPAITAYTTGQKFSFKATNANTGASTLNVNSLGTKSIVKNGSTALGANDIISGQIYTVQYDGTNFQFISPNGNTAQVKFGGTGADGALSISSGTTTIDCANAAIVVKNYTSISITGTGKLAFSNPNTNGTTIILKSQGVVTISSSVSPAIDLSGMGAAGGGAANAAGGTNGGGSGGGGASVKSNGSNGVAGFGGATPATGSSGIGGTLYLESCTGGVGGQAGGAQGGTAYNTNISLSNIQKIKGVFMMPGAGGGGGQGNTNDGGAGGAGAKGGGALYIECGGTYTCSSTISTAGLVGSAATPGGTYYAGDGGSGGGGTIFILYNTLGSDTGTYTVSGGASSGGGTRRIAGGAGATSVSLVAQNTEFV